MQNNNGEITLSRSFQCSKGEHSAEGPDGNIVAIDEICLDPKCIRAPKKHGHTIMILCPMHAEQWRRDMEEIHI